MIVRNTWQKEAILKTLQKLDIHPTAQELHTIMKDDYPTLSLGTVYRNLNALAKSNQILRIDLEDSSVHFDGKIDFHMHVHCKMCNTISDVDLDQEALALIEQLKVKVDQKGHALELKHLILPGVCNHCLKEENEKEKNYEEFKRYKNSN